MTTWYDIHTTVSSISIIEGNPNTNQISRLTTPVAIVLVPKDMPFDFSRFVKSWIFTPIRLVAISRAMTDDKVTHGRCCFIATSPSPTTFRSVVGRFRRPLATDFANLARLSNTVVQTLDRRIYAAAGDDRSQSLDVGFLEIHPVEKFGFVRCSVSIFHLMILLYFYLSANLKITVYRGQLRSGNDSTNI